MKEPFQRLGRRVLTENRWHRYCHDRYTQRDGSEGDYYYVDIAGSSAIVPVLEDGRVVVIRQRRYLLGVDLWEFPIGGIADGENALDVAKKELAEESGYRAASWTALGRFAPYKGVSNELCHVFLATELTRGEQQLEITEDIEVHVMELEEARERMLASLDDVRGLGDGQSLSALAYYDRYRRARRD